MIVGFTKRKFEVPPDVRRGARLPTVDVSHCSDECDWITCCYATPHRDLHFSDSFFITLAVVSSHEVGCENLKPDYPSIAVPKGTFFVIDPRLLHWLHPADAWRTSRPKPFVGLQWTVGRRNLARSVARIVTSCEP